MGRKRNTTEANTRNTVYLFNRSAFDHSDLTENDNVIATAHSSLSLSFSGRLAGLLDLDHKDARRPLCLRLPYIFSFLAATLSIHLHTAARLVHCERVIGREFLLGFSFEVTDQPTRTTIPPCVKIKR